MGYKFQLLVAIILVLAVSSILVTAAIAPSRDIAIQGLLKTSPGNVPVPDGTYSVRFRIYNDSSAGATDACPSTYCLYQKITSVTTSGGTFSVVLDNIPNLPWDQQYYIGIKVGNDPEMTPRANMTFTAYSFASSRLLPTVWDINTTGNLYVTGCRLATYVGLTNTSYTGSLSYGGNSGYVAANAICNASYPGSHLCFTEEILESIRCGKKAAFTDGATAWIANGPPGYTANANDCIGWTSNSNSVLGAFWLFNTTRGGEGWLVNCAQTKKLACCR